MQNVTRKGYIEMNLAELDYYIDAVEILKDDKKSLSDDRITLVLRNFHETPVEKRTKDDGITFLIANAIRKHSGIPYPAF